MSGEAFRATVDSHESTWNVHPVHVDGCLWSTRGNSMKRLVALLLVALLVPAAVPGGVTTGAIQRPATADISPGTAVSGALDAQDQVVSGSIGRSGLEQRLAATESPTGRAGVIATELDRLETRLADVENRIRTLRAARDDGSIERGTYAVRVAPVVVTARSVNDSLGRLETAATGVENETLREAGVTAARIETLRNRTRQVVATDAGALATGTLGRGFYRQVATAVETHNAQVGDRDFGVLGSVFGGERVTVRVVTDAGTTETFSFRTTETGRIRDVRAGDHPSTTLVVTTDEATARQIANSDDPAETASEALYDGDITLHGLGPVKRVRMFVVGGVVDVVRAAVSSVDRAEL